MKTGTKLSLFCATGILLWSSASYAIPVDETANVSSLQVGLTNIQPGTLFLCETQGIALGAGSCSDRAAGATTSDEVVFNQLGPNALQITMQSNLEQGEVNPPPADQLNLFFPTPFASISEPNGNMENVNQTFRYSPAVGQPGFALLNGVALTYDITSDVRVPEPPSLLLLVCGLIGTAALARTIRNNVNWEQ